MAKKTNKSLDAPLEENEWVRCPNPTYYNVGGLLKHHDIRKKTNVKFKPITQLKYYCSKSHALTFKLTITNIIQEVKIRPLTYWAVLLRLKFDEMAKHI